MTIAFPALAVAARRLGLDGAELAESVLHAVDCGFCEMEATRMALVDYLRGRGLYRGELRELVDSGRVFSMEATEHGEIGNRGAGRRASGDRRGGWAADVLVRLRRHQRRELAGLLSMMDADLAD